jgi:hypothetical protein
MKFQFKTISALALQEIMQTWRVYYVIYANYIASMDEFLKLYEPASLKDLQEIANKLLKAVAFKLFYTSKS